VDSECTAVGHMRTIVCTVSFVRYIRHSSVSNVLCILGKVLQLWRPESFKQQLRRVYRNGIGGVE